jgi:copper chaperone CopZ
MRNHSLTSLMTLCAVLAGMTPVYAAGTPAQKSVAAQTTPQRTQDIRVGVNGMVCDFCAQTLKKTFGKNDAVDSVDISLEDKLVTVHVKPGRTLDDATITKTISDAGYAVTTIHRP